MQDAIVIYENGKAIGGEGHPTDADDITFDNSNTDLVSENVNDAIVEVNGKKAETSDLTSISQSGTTASQAISAGTFFYLNGTLVRALVAIASGATFTLNTNYEVVTDGALNKIEQTETKYHYLSGQYESLGAFTENVTYTIPQDGIYLFTCDVTTLSDARRINIGRAIYVTAASPVILPLKKGSTIGILSISTQPIVAYRLY